MKYTFLHTHAQSEKCIIFFGGFATQAAHFAHLSADCDVIMVYDYRDFVLPQAFFDSLASYKMLYLIAFSMGVSIAPHFISTFNLHRKIAINGTNIGIDRHFGIHPLVFKKTISHLNVPDFKTALFGTQSDMPLSPKYKLQAELQSLYNYALNKPHLQDFSYDVAFLSLNDKIFPFSASKVFFDSRIPPVRIVESPAPHFAFLAFQSWEEICTI